MNIARRLAHASRPDARRRSNFDLAPPPLLRLLLLSPLLFALLGVHSSAQTAAVNPATAGERRTNGAITGRVVGEDGSPLPNVRVFSSRVGGAPGFAMSTTSDGEGKFALSNLAFGSYLVNAFAPAYLLEPNPLGNSAGRTYHHIGDSLTLRMIRGGVITGAVTDANGDPVVGLIVIAVRVRGADGRAATEAGGWQPRRTDDRGVYRIYGLRPGAYVVRAGGTGSLGQPTAHDADAPTYHPATTRDGASEVSVQAGQEMTGIDIRYRGEAGHSISGTLSGSLPADPSPSGTVFISLKHVSASAPEIFAYVQPGTGNRSFSFDGVGDGDYDIVARTGTAGDSLSAATATPRRVNVRGADVPGIELTLAPLASVSGQLLLDELKLADGKRVCQPSREPRAGEVIVLARRDEAHNAAASSFPFFTAANESAPDGKGEFQVRHLRAGRHRLEVRLPAEDFYLRAIAFATPLLKPNATPTAASAAPRKTPIAAASPARAARPATATNDPARDGFNLKAGESLTGLTIHIAPGAATLRGRVVVAAADGTANADAPSAARPLHAHLVPAEREQADNVLRYAETPVGADGSFAFANLAPGAYRLIARPAPVVGASTDAPPRPLAWDAAARAQLRSDADNSTHVAVALAPCQRLNDYLLRYESK